MKKILLVPLIPVLVLAGIVAYVLFAEIAPVCAGSKAKILCSRLLTIRRDIESLLTTTSNGSARCSE